SRIAALLFAQGFCLKSRLGAGLWVHLRRGARVRRPGGRGAPIARRDLLALSAITLATGIPRVGWAAAPQGQLTWGIHVSLAPTWFDPAETPGIITPFMNLYAMHDAMLKPMPGNPATPCLAESF